MGESLMPSGRVPLPSAVKLRKGNARGINADEPIPPKDDFGAPEWLMKDMRALAMWNHLYPILREMGVLTVVDAGVLASYCSAYSDWVLAREYIIKCGPLSETCNKAGNSYVSTHPYVTIAEKSQVQMHKCGALLGLNPSDRTKLQARKLGGGDGKAKDKWHGALG